MASEVHSAIEEAVRRSLIGTPLRSINVEQVEDHSGEDAFYITVDIPPGVPRLGGQKFLTVNAAASHALLDRGDTRFPYLRFVYAEEQAAEEGDRATSSSS